MIDFEKYPNLLKFMLPQKLDKYISENVLLPTPKRFMQTKEGIKLANRLKSIFGDPTFYFSFLGVGNKTFTEVYLSSLKRSKKHNRDRIKLIEVLELILAGKANEVIESIKRLQMLSKLKKNKDLRDKFLKGNLDLQDLQDLI